MPLVSQGGSSSPSGAAGGDLSGTYPNPSVATVNGVSATLLGVTKRSARASNTILAAADRGTLIDATAAFTQTITAAATLGAGWWCYLRNATTDGTSFLVVDPNGAETIDGLATITMYSGDTRLVLTDGSNWFTELLSGGFAKLTPGASTFTFPTRFASMKVIAIGAGGGGGGGRNGNGSASSGGSGGGGGCVAIGEWIASDVSGASASVSVPAGGTGGAANTNGNPATASFTSFTWSSGAYGIEAGGGGGGTAGAVGASVHGGGGGTPFGAGTRNAGGNPTASGTNPAVGSMSALVAAVGVAGNPSEYGGASGGGSTTGGVGLGGASSFYGGPSGGGGGGVSAGAGFDGGPGGDAGEWGTGDIGAGTGGGSPTNGNSGNAARFPYCGNAAGGGGGGTAVAGANGGAGQVGAGGGGGGSTTLAAGAGSGGNGGDGEVRVFYR